MGYAEIKSVTAQATAIAQAQGLTPITVRAAIMTFNGSQRITFPFLGDYVPEGWSATGETWYVDLHGSTDADQSAITMYEVKRRIERMYGRRSQDVGLGLTERGERNGYVQIYRKVGG